MNDVVDPRIGKHKRWRAASRNPDLQTSVAVKVKDVGFGRSVPEFERWSFLEYDVTVSLVSGVLVVKDLQLDVVVRRYATGTWLETEVQVLTDSGWERIRPGYEPGF